LRNAEDKLNDLFQNYNKKIGDFKNELLKLQKILEEDRSQYELNLEARIKEINTLDVKFSS